MFGFIMFLHTLACILLVVIILMQSGRGGGLTESFSSAESMFGAKTNVVMVKATTILSTLFFITCLSLAYLSAQKSKSLMGTQVAVDQEAAKADAESTNPAVDEQKEQANADQNKPATQPVAESGSSQNP